MAPGRRMYAALAGFGFQPGAFGWARCSGAWIGAHKLLTAAHCVTLPAGRVVDPESVYVLMGPESAREMHPAIRVDAHPDFSYSYRVVSEPYVDMAPYVYDLAVLTFQYRYEGVPAIVTNQPPEFGQTLVIAGYGRTNSELDGTAGLYGRTPVDAVDAYRIYWQFDGEEESNTCMGDSGGPAYIDFGSGFRLVGVTSGGTSPYCMEGDISFEMRVDSALEWLFAVTEGDLAFDYYTLGEAS